MESYDNFGDDCDYALGGGGGGGDHIAKKMANFGKEFDKQGA